MATKTTKTAVEENTTAEKAAEPLYSVEDLIANSNIFNTHKDVVKTALQLMGRKEYTVSEATEIIINFKNKEVK